MNKTILMTATFLVGASSLATAPVCAVAASQPLLLAQDNTSTTPDSARTDRIDRNTESRTDNRIERREDAADAAGMPGLNRGIERRNDRREDRRDELRTGQPPQSAVAPQ